MNKSKSLRVWLLVFFVAVVVVFVLAYSQQISIEELFAFFSSVLSGNHLEKDTPLTSMPLEGPEDESNPLDILSDREELLFLTHTPTLTPTVTRTYTPTPTATVTRTPTPTTTSETSMCDWFDQDQMSLTTFDIQPGSTDFTLHVKKDPPGWPGIEFEDGVDWVYTAFLGDIEAEKCVFEGYAGRLYCYFKGLPAAMMDTTQVLEILSNHCHLIYRHERVSIMGPVQTPTASKGTSCTSGLGRLDCAAAGGTYSCTPTCGCVCP